jgi:hypothetical protein
MIKQLLLSLLILGLGSTAIGAPVPDPNPKLPPELSPNSFDGRHRGLTYYDGKTVVQPTYSDISYCGNGFFTLTSLDTNNKFEFGKERFIVNNFGKQQKFRLPEGCALADIFSLGESADDDTSLVIDKLPSSTLLRFTQNKMSGLCTLDGSIVLPLQEAVVSFLKPGRALINEKVWRFNRKDSKSCKVMDLKTGEITDASPEQIPKSFTRRIDFSKPLMVSPSVQFPVEKNARFQVIAPGRLLKSVNVDTGEFDSKYWGEHRTVPVSRVEMFNRLLRQYNLIGMSDEQLFGLLGCGIDLHPKGYQGDIASAAYYLESGGCDPWSALRAKIYFVDNKVESWCFLIGRSKESTKNYSNVIIVNESSRKNPRNPRIFPDTQAK